MSAERLLDVAQNLTGVQIRDLSFIKARLQRRLVELGFSNLSQYERHLQNDPQEKFWFIHHITTHKTSWFRERDQFDILIEHLRKQAGHKAPLIWSAACSSGEEIYSVLMTLRHFGFQGAKGLATDIDQKSVETGVAGTYRMRADHLQEIPMWARQYFWVSKDRQRVKVSDELTASVRFRRHNILLDDLPLQKTKFDAIFLRNVLIYFNERDKNHAIEQVRRYLKPEGLLFLGVSESVDGLEKTWLREGVSVWRQKSSKLTSSSPVSVAPVVQKIKVLIIDDSPAIQKFLRRVLEKSGIQVVGVANDPIEGEELREKFQPDLITLDLHMPKKSGVDYMRDLQRKKIPQRVIIVTSGAPTEGGEVLQALDYGAFDYVQKPEAPDLDGFSKLLVPRIHAALKTVQTEKRTLVRAKNLRLRQAPPGLIVIGASTGGTNAIRELLEAFPSSIPPVLIAQHMPASFTAQFAKRLDQLFSFHVKEAVDGELIQTNTVYIAPGDWHMTIQSAAGQSRVELTQTAHVNGFRPSVDVLFQSALALKNPKQVAGLLLTGMGVDGAQGLLQLKNAGGLTLAQDEQSSAVFGMPKAAADLGAALELLPPGEMAHVLFGFEG